MAKYDNQLERMQFLMAYDNKINESAKYNSVEFHTKGADNKEYGIIKEGTYYYIKESTPDKATLAENYEYIGGFNNRSANRYSSYNEASKQLELKLMSLNEAYGKNKDVTIADLHKTEKAMSILTEQARQDINRMNQIFENSFISKTNIGDHGDSEKKGSSTGANTTKNNDPFTEKASATLDKDVKLNGTVECATSDYEKVSEPKMDDTSMKKGGKALNDFKDAHDDLEGEGVADQHKSGAKAVKINESALDNELVGFDDVDFDYEEDAAADDAMVQGDKYEQQDADMADMEDDLALSDEDLNIDDDEIPFADDENEEGQEDLETLLEEFMSDEQTEETIEEELKEDCECTDKDCKCTDKDCKCTDKVCKCDKEHIIVGPNKVLDGPHGTGNSVHGEKTMDRISESIDRITERIVENFCGKKKSKKKKETIMETIDRLVSEELTRLDAFGKHPRYRKAPMTVPVNKEVIVNDGDHDWNDESAKGEQPYGSKIGSSAPFDQTVEEITGSILNSIKEGLKKKR